MGHVEVGVQGCVFWGSNSVCILHPTGVIEQYCTLELGHMVKISPLYLKIFSNNYIQCKCNQMNVMQ